MCFSPDDASHDGDHPIAPLLERSRIDSDAELEIAVSVSGTADIEENELDVFLGTDRVDPGGRIELGVFVSGTGRVTENDLSVFYDGDELIDLEDPGVVRRNSGPGSAESTEATADAGIEAVRAGQTGRRIDGRRSTLFRRDSSDAGGALRWKPLDGNRTGEPAYLLEINTRKATPPGEYVIPVVFTYRSDSGIRQVERVPRVRVTTRRERLEPWLARGLMAAVVLGAFVAFAAWGPLLWF
ncbi:hypothetical protein EA462_12495 [Natrarchaeobius halalkaliphilus]|uniref:DUF8164 domain-containing protein n=1 Tax=Natrarchaeobius halalkaliphilus TaxID=1679091 RepID=A0A3N6NX28_9EURY|nr:hypothetical protein [Natrarchaeobius halalkaliphilus]RQG89179.1 hypothetical protein EA462_12495 [Natrarchaeobius halalkaliphilus]